MIEVLTDMPEGVAGVSVSGRLRGDDLREFKPAMEGLLKYGEIESSGSLFPVTGFGPGGLIEDLKLGLGALIRRRSAFKRLAVVSDNDWVSHALHAFAWMVPGELRCSASTSSSGQGVGRRLTAPIANVSACLTVSGCSSLL